jgi:hypothetical protein
MKRYINSEQFKALSEVAQNEISVKVLGSQDGAIPILNLGQLLELVDGGNRDWYYNNLTINGEDHSVSVWLEKDEIELVDILWEIIKQKYG